MERRCDGVGGGVAFHHIAEVGIVADFHHIVGSVFHLMPRESERHVDSGFVGRTDERRVAESLQTAAEEHRLVFVAHAVDHAHGILPLVALVFNRNFVAGGVTHIQEIFHLLGECGRIH